jgi:hypothetical protein
MNGETENLKRQVQFAHEIIARLDIETIFLKAVVLGLVNTNPHKAILAQAIESEKELYLSAATYKAIPDAAIAAARAKLDRVLDTLRSQPPSG